MSDFQRRRIEQRWQDLQKEWEQAKADCEHWNRTHPNEPPLVFDWDLQTMVESRRTALTDKPISDSTTLEEKA